MDSTVVTTVAGIGASVILARSVIGTPARWIIAAVWFIFSRPNAYDEPPVDFRAEFCVYCTAFHVGWIFHWCGVGWTPWWLIDAFYLAGVAWPLVECLDFLSGLWTLLLERRDGFVQGTSREALASEDSQEPFGGPVSGKPGHSPDQDATNQQ